MRGIWQRTLTGCGTRVRARPPLPPSGARGPARMKISPSGRLAVAGCPGRVGSSASRVVPSPGRLRMRSRPGEGTTLLAELPTRPGQPATASRPDGEIFILAGPRAPDGGNGGRARTRVPQPVSVRCQIPRMLPGRPGYASVQGVPGPGADSGGLLVIGPRLPAEQASGSPGTGRREPARSAGGRGRPMGEAVIRAQAMAARITRARMSRLHLTALHGSVERACRLAARSRWSCDAGSPSRA